MKKGFLLLLLLAFGCTPKPRIAAISIMLVDSGKAVKFNGLDYAVISEIDRDSVQGIWQGLFPVYKMPADSELKSYQPAQPGIYKLRDSAVVFTPDTPFATQQTYFARCYQFAKNDNIWAFIKGKKRMGATTYIDLIFKR